MLFKALKPNFMSKGIMIDYERTTFNAVETDFLGNEIKSCFSHMSECGGCHAQEYLEKKSEKPEFS